MFPHATQPSDRSPDEDALPLLVLQAIADLVAVTAASGGIQLTERGALLLALASGGSEQQALRLFQQAIFDAADEGPPSYEEDLDAVMPLEDASIEETLRQLGCGVDVLPDPEPSGRTHPTSSVPEIPLDGRPCMHGATPTRDACAMPARSVGARGRRAPAGRGSWARVRPGRIPVRRWRPEQGLTPRRAPNVRRGLGVPRRLD
jgi:hypothetical protein